MHSVRMPISWAKHYYITLTVAILSPSSTTLLVFQYFSSPAVALILTVFMGGIHVDVYNSY